MSNIYTIYSFEITQSVERNHRPLFFLRVNAEPSTRLQVQRVSEIQDINIKQRLLRPYPITTGITLPVDHVHRQTQHSLPRIRHTFFHLRQNTSPFSSIDQARPDGRSGGVAFFHI